MSDGCRLHLESWRTQNRACDDADATGIRIRRTTSQREADILAAQEELQKRHLRLIENWDQLTERVRTHLDRLDSKDRS
ncbi:MAG: hypothetical protein ABGZ35_09455 [Planctomycetaceae bacterium]